MTQELVLSDQTYMPAMSIPQAVARFNTLVEFVQTVMRDGIDYGKIPNTTKPTLLKPGAEKLTTLFGLTTRFVVVEKTEDWTGDDHGGEPFFYYWYRCQLWRGDRLIAEADGSCNSRESKYRWRSADRKCPTCDQPTIIKGKQEYGGGWLCFAKKGGCGAKFREGDPAIEGQQTGRVPNADIADQVNTFQKMSQKRALIAATLIGVNASEFFTQDVEDIPSLGNGASYVPPRQWVNSITGEVTDTPANPAQENPRRAAILIRLAALIEEAGKAGFIVPDTELIEGKTDDELIAAGKSLRTRLDAFIQENKTAQQADDLSSEWDDIEKSAAERKARMEAPGK